VQTRSASERVATKGRGSQTTFTSEHVGDTHKEKSKVQKVNGVEHVSTPAAQVPNAMSDPAPLPPDVIAKLKEPLPPGAVSPNPQKPGLSVIKVIYVVDRLNEVFGMNGWRFVGEVVESGPMVVVKGSLKVAKYKICIEQYGGNDNADRGDAYKGACTDALSKCASYLGIGMDVYKGLHDSGRNGVPGPPNGSKTHAQRRPAPRRNQPEPTGLTSANMVTRFGNLRVALGVEAYTGILASEGYREASDIQNLERARAVYRRLLEVFRERFGESMKSLGVEEYSRILGELRLHPRAKLNPEQAIRVFNHMQETLNARE